MVYYSDSVNFCAYDMSGYVSNYWFTILLSIQFTNYNSRWFTEARIPYEFRPRHALLTMHVWFLHKRLLADRVDSHLALLVQVRVICIIITYSTSMMVAFILSHYLHYNYTTIGGTV